MKYLKLYKIFENISKQDIREICYELTDDQKFDIQINDNFIIIQRSNRFKNFELKDIEDVIFRLIDYLGTEYKCIHLAMSDNDCDTSTWHGPIDDNFMDIFYDPDWWYISIETKNEIK